MGEVSLRGRRWNTKPIGPGECITVSEDRRWTITEGNSHFTLLDHGAVVARLPSAKQCVEEAERRSEAA